jgi:hypothetical protein
MGRTKHAKTAQNWVISEAILAVLGVDLVFILEGLVYLWVEAAFRDQGTAGPSTHPQRSVQLSHPFRKRREMDGAPGFWL